MIVFQSRPVLVFIYEEGDLYSDHMNRNTFKNEEVEDRLNCEYYFLPLRSDAYYPSGLPDSLNTFNTSENLTIANLIAQELGTINNQLPYPSIVIFNHNLEIIYNSSGYINEGSMVFLLSLVSRETH